MSDTTAKDDGKEIPSEPDVKSRAEEEIDSALATSALQDKAKGQRKKQIRRGILILCVFLLPYGSYYLFKPFEGSLAYGICKVFLELNVNYPSELKLSEVIELGDSVRIWYTRLDPFGEYRMEQIQCYFKNDDAGPRVSKITVNRRDVDRAVVDRFNSSFSTIVQSEPDLTLPFDFPDNISGLRFETDRFRRPIF